MSCAARSTNQPTNRIVRDPKASRLGNGHEMSGAETLTAGAGTLVADKQPGRVVVTSVELVLLRW
jgi:hypothetical protein